MMFQHMPRRLLKITVLAGALALGGCSLFATPSQFEPVDLTEYTQTTVPAAAWSASIGSGSGVGFAPAVAGDSAVAATPDGSVARVALSNGAVQWKTSVGKSLSAGVGTDGNIAVVAAPDGTITALDMAGKTLWTAKASTRVSTPPAVGQGVVVVRADDYRVQGFDAGSGELLWNYQRTNAALALRAVSRMIIDKGNVLVAVPSGRLVALDLKTGRLQWDILAGPIRGVTDLDSVTDVVGSPVLVGNGVCVATYQGNAGCYTPGSANGQALWSQPFSSATGVTLNNDSLYATGIHGEVVRMALGNGQQQWVNKVLKNRGLTNAVSNGNIVAVGDYEGYIHYLSDADGHLLGRSEFGGEAMLSPLTATAQGILVQTGAGNLVMLGAR